MTKATINGYTYEILRHNTPDNDEIVLTIEMTNLDYPQGVADQHELYLTKNDLHDMLAALQPDQTKPIGFHWETGEPVDNPSDCDYETTDSCDACNTRALGTMLHARGASGRVCPVLFVCHSCGQHSPETTL